MWNARRNDDGSDGDVFSCPAVYCCSAVQRFSGKSFLRGESSAAAGGSTGGAVIRGCDDAASFFMTEKRTEGDGWKISSRQCGIRYRRFGREARQKISCLPGQKQRKRIRRSRIRSPGPGAERGQTESKEQGTEEDQKDGTQKDETQKDGMEITEPEQTETGITEPAAGESASTAEPKRHSLSRRRPSKPAAHRVRFSTRRPTRFRRQFPLTFLLTRSAPDPLLRCRSQHFGPAGRDRRQHPARKRPDPAGKCRRPADSDLSYPFAGNLR